MQISTARFYNRSALQMSRLNSTLEGLNVDLSSTKRLHVPSQDSASWSMLGGIRKDTADAAAYKSNMTLSRGLLAQADSALDNTSERLVRVRELAVRAGSETLNTQDRVAMAAELDQIREGLMSIANGRDIRNHPIFGGTGDVAFTKDALTGVVSYSGNASIATVRIGEASEIQVGVDGGRVFGGTSGGVDIFAMIDDLKVALDPSLDQSPGPVLDADAASQAYRTAISTGLSRLDAAEAQVASARSANGARAARLEIESTQLDDIGIDRESARVDLEATDIPATMVEFQKTLTILNATQAAISKMSNLSLFNYLK